MAPAKASTHPMLSMPSLAEETSAKARPSHDGESGPTPTNERMIGASGFSQRVSTSTVPRGLPSAPSALHQHASHIDAAVTRPAVHADHEQQTSNIKQTLPSNQNDIKETVLTVCDSVNPSRDFCLSPVTPPKRSKPTRRRLTSISTDIPRQTILKAMVSKAPIFSPPIATASMSSASFPFHTSMAEAMAQSDDPLPTSPLDSSSLAASLANLHTTSTLTPSMSNVLKSPCFFHQRFDGIVDIQRVLDEVAEENYTHSRLMQTATGVREISKQLQRRPLKRAVKTIMIVTRARDNSLVYLTKELAEWLMSTPRYGSDMGVDVYVDAKLRNSKRFDAQGMTEREPRYRNMLKYWTPDLCWSSPETFDLVLTLGGDGTVLFTSWLFQRIVPPVLPFALGSLGFLTNFDFGHYKEHLNSIMGDAGMRVNLRMRFTCTVWRADKSPGAEKGAMEEGEQFEVLNELVIDRGPSAYVSNLELYGDDELLTIVQADGCIFSTPTGSTAYSLSAGGSLIHPSIPAILLTPICPHTLSFRPMVLSDALALRIAVPHKSRSSAYCSFDGKGRIELKQGDYVTLEASQYPFPSVMRVTNEWVESVQRALRWNVRGAEQKGWGDSDGNDGDGEEEEEEKWDIDIDASGYDATTDSGIGPSEDGESTVGGVQGGGTASPMRRQMSLLNM